MSTKIPKFPGFSPLSDQVFTRPGQAVGNTGQSQKHSNDPTTVLLFGWGDGLPKHVAKYADGFRDLFPHATQVVVLSPISRAMFSDLRQRSDYMLPVLNAIFNNKQIDNSRILVHTMSNTGAVNYAATLNAYQEVYKHPMPHDLLIMDSTPGSTEFSLGNASRWSRAMALGTAAWFPWPFLVTQSIWAVFLLLNTLYAWMVGKESPGAWSVRAVNDTKYEVKRARRLYLYSKDDDLILWEDIERHVAETRPLGWKADVEVFSGSGHVGHMRMFPAQYWGAIRRSWKKAVQGGS
ncbi:hypothetical protein QQS21_007026 [Conoideocrella luteorostrata]|uniref:DUF829-domain-containing protein n=1 Tax=Conoideocrella luteorostrata TaxID=1105319 RepID=A0AAJ0CLM0_9HYPO|nr:hypothetical protein QQS21_007026 [Conoideocrella luteorostrata]